jgi:transcriptional regulator with XRE-family HTH domain
MSRKRLSQRDVASLLGGWSQSRVAKLLTGRVEMTVDDLGDLCFVIGISPVEAIRDHGLEFLAEMTPTELRFLERPRQLPQSKVDALIQLTDVERMTRIQPRRAKSIGANKK